MPDVPERGRKFHNTRYYKNAATPQQQQQRRPPQWKQNRRGGFKGRGEQKKEGGEIPVSNQDKEEENWDAPSEVVGNDGGELATDDVSEEGNLNEAADVNAEDEGEKAENEDEVTADSEETEKESPTEAESISKGSDEADLKETIIIEATKK